MNSPNQNTTDEKNAKARVIEGMLNELDMSKQDLIDLIKAITEQSVSEDKGVDIEQVELPEGLSIEEIAKHVAEGNIEYLSRYLSLEELQRINIKLGMAFNLKRAIELGITLDSAKISQLIGIPGINNLQLSGKYHDKDGKQRNLSTEHAQSLSKSVGALINNRSLARGANIDQNTRNQLSQITNDPNSFSNPTASVNIVQRVISAVKSQLDNLGASASTGTSLAAQQQQLRQTQNMARTMQQTFTQMRRHERRLRNVVPEMGRTRKVGNDMFATVRTKSGEREVNLKDYLRGSNRLTPRTEKLINKLTSLNDKLDNGLSTVNRGLPEGKNFAFDAAGRMQAVVEEGNTQKLVQVVDYINDLRRDLNRMKDRVETKKQEVATKKAEARNESDIQRMKDLTRGPELDNAAAKIAVEQEASLKFVTMQPDAHDFNSEKTEKKEIKRTADELVKLDAMADKNKMLEAMKGTNEMKNIESSMKTVMKDMDEAEKNKDLLKDLQLQKRGINLDK